MTDPSGRITRVDAPIVSPGNCGICGKTDHPLGFADARLDFEFYGTLYFCADCVGEYARIFGYVSPDEIIKLREHVAAQDLELNTHRQAILGLESTVDGLIGDAHRRITDRAERIDSQRRANDDDDDSEREMDEPDAGASSESPPESVNTPAQPADRPAQPVNEQRRDNLFDTSSADELLGLT